MKTWNRFPFLFFAFLLITFSCGKEEKGKEVPEEIDNPKLREETGGAPDETITIVSGSFKSSEMNCKKGFGLCDLEFEQSVTSYSDTTKKTDGAIKKYDARFQLSTAGDSLRIEFNEEIPHFANIFAVGSGDTLKNIMGHEYIIPVKGKYKTEKNTANKFGAVTIKVIKGGEKSSYPVNPNKDTSKQKKTK